MAPGSLPQGLYPRLAGFCDFLRRRGMGVGTSEEVDAARALGEVEKLRREDFFLACRTTLLKHPNQSSLFDACFEEYWLEGVGGFQPPPLEKDVEGAIPVASHPIIGGERLAAEAAAQFKFIYSPDAPPRDLGVMGVDPRQLDTMKRLARRFRRWAATLEGRRFEAHRRGPPDYPRTTRASLRWGGEMLLLRRRRRKIQRTRLVVLWDISGSMEGHGPQLLALIYALLRTSPSAEVFAFSTDLEPLNPVVRGRPYREVVRLVSRRLSKARGGTRIGRCLHQFNEGYGRTVDDYTVVLILSDGWDLGELEVLERELAALRRRCRFLVWMNPHADQPGFRPEAAGMKRALPHVDLMIPMGAMTGRVAYHHFIERATPRPKMKRGFGLQTIRVNSGAEMQSRPLDG